MSSVIFDQGDKTAIIFGSTGLVGLYVLQKALANNAYKKVVVFNRRSLKFQHPKFVEHVINFDELDRFGHLIKGNDLFMCLGTTRAKAGSRKQFIKVDLTYSLKVIKYAYANDVNQLLLVSCVGSNPDSSFTHTKVKGYLELAVKEIPFWATHIFQPSVLLGNRAENRLGEQIAGKVGKVLNAVSEGILQKYQPIEAEIVAEAMIKAAQFVKKGLSIYTLHEIEKMDHEKW